MGKGEILLESSYFVFVEVDIFPKNLLRLLGLFN